MRNERSFPPRLFRPAFIAAFWRRCREDLFPDWKDGPTWSLALAEFGNPLTRVWIDFGGRTVHLSTNSGFDHVEIVHALAHAASGCRGHSERWYREMESATFEAERLGWDWAGDILDDASRWAGETALRAAPLKERSLPVVPAPAAAGGGKRRARR